MSSILRLLDICGAQKPGWVGCRAWNDELLFFQLFFATAFAFSTNVAFLDGW